MRTSEDNTKNGLGEDFLEHPCSGFYYLTELEDASCKTYLFMPMQSRDNDKIFQLSVEMLDNHDNDAHLRWMIAMLV